MLWDAQRQNVFAKHFGVTMESLAARPDVQFQDELEFINFELTHNEKAAGNDLKAATAMAARDNATRC